MTARQIAKSVLPPSLVNAAHWLLRRGPDLSRIGPSQSNEADLIDQLLRGRDIRPTFCEFGFTTSEFNCGRLVRRGWKGLLIDGDTRNVEAAQDALAKGRLNVSAEQAFLNLGNLRSTIMHHFHVAPGVLSIDVDGNDYWFLEALLPWEPQLVIVEYNASLGLRPLTVPYDRTFERHAKHPSGWYHGASITALHALCARSGYRLVAVSDSGVNLFFMRDAARSLEPGEAYRESLLRNSWSNTTAPQQWQTICDLPFITVA
jgi:hypothetical protein